jgi:hypothetical protein
LAFITAGKGDVLNVIAEKPSYLNYTKPLKITLSPPKEGYTSIYAFNFFELNVKNESHYPLTTIDFNVKINNAVEPVTWTGNIPAYQSRLIRLDVQPYDIQNDNTFEIEAVKVNETSLSDTRLSGTFNKPLEATPYIFVDIKPDNWADENTYTIKDRDGQVVHTFGPYPAGSNSLKKDSLQLEANQIYCFEVVDLWGDGIAGQGYVKLKKSDKLLFAQDLGILQFGVRIFFATTLPDMTAIHSPQAISIKTFVDHQNNICLQGDLSGQTALALYSLAGQCVWKREKAGVQSNNDIRIPADGLSGGFYLLKIERNNQRETFKILIR